MKKVVKKNIKKTIKKIEKKVMKKAVTPTFPINDQPSVITRNNLVG